MFPGASKRVASLWPLWAARDARRLLSNKPPPAPAVNGDDPAAATTPAPQTKTTSLHKTPDSDSKGDSAQAAEITASKKAIRLAGKKKAALTKPCAASSPFLAFEAFPKPPKAIRNASESMLNQVRLNRAFYPANADEIGVPRHAAAPSPPLQLPTAQSYHDFGIPSRYLHGAQPNNEADRLLNELNDFLSLLPAEFSDLHQPPHVEHPLKRSWLKLVPLNPRLHQIANEYLWQLVPQGKFFNSPPFDGYTATLDGFRRWEAKMKQQAQLKLQRSLKEQQEADQAIKEFSKTNSFLGPVPGGRKKLNRKLVKTFRKLQTEGKLGKKDDDK